MLSRASKFEAEERLVAGAGDLVEPLRAAAAGLSEARAMSRDVLDKLRDAELLCMMRPERFGGRQVPLKTVIKVSNALARGDASAAWVHGVYTGHDILISRFPETAQADFWSSSDLPLSASSLVPTGKATPVAGGWELSGTWSFCSGIDHTGWTIVGAMTGPVAGDPPRPERRLFLVPASEYRIVDDWHVMGLRGTGSKSIVLDGVFVPEDRAVRDEVMARPAAENQAAGIEAGYPVWPLMSFALVGLAATIAQNAYEHALGEINAGAGKPNPLFEMRRPAAAMHLAEASAKIDAAELLYDRALEETFAIVEAGEALTMARRVRNRRDQCFAAKLAHEAVSTLLGIGGARGIREGGVVQRAYRDMCALVLHPASNWDATAISFGTVAMGGAPTEAIV